MSRLIKWENVCLVCLQKGENRCIFGKDNDSIVIADKVMKYSDILIKIDRNQPKSICLQCLDDLNVAYKFRRNYEQSDSIIKALLNTNHQEFRLKDLWKTNSTKVNPILDICIKDEVVDNTTVDDRCEKTPCLNLEDDADTKSKLDLEDRADAYVHSPSTEQNIIKTVQNSKSRQKRDSKIPKRSRGRQKILSEESSFTSGYKRPVMQPRVQPKQSTGVSLKICEICNYGFRYQTALDVHMRRHNNERPFSCNHCDKAFVTSSALRCHVRVHTGERPYKCQYCDLRFSTNEVKKNHESYHTGEKPYKCPTCDKSFGYSKGLMRHLQIHNKSTCKEFRRENLSQKHANHHLNRPEVNKSSEHTQTKSLDKEVFHIQENTNSNEIIIKHEIVEDELTDSNCDRGGTSCIDGDNGPVCEASSGEIVQQSKGEIAKHPKVGQKQSTRVSSKICEICNYGFRYKSALAVHMRRHNNERPFSCDHCDKAFVTGAALRWHVKVHTGEKPYKCQYCDLRFADRNVRLNHESKHTGEKPYKCPNCDKSFGYSQGLKWHLRHHNSENKFTCKECGKRFTRKELFQKHVNRHLNRDELNEPSEQTQKKSLRKEIFQIQENANSNEINIKHEIIEDDLIGSNCDIQSTPCVDVGNGPVSEATNGEIVSLKICEICNHGFRHQSTLNVHMRRHNKQRHFSCDHCEKAFVTGAELRCHMRVHTGEKPYKCQYCDLRFSDNTVKKNHESKHTGEKPFKCPTCDKSFGYSKGLTKHLRVHNKFSCKECGKEFTKKKLFQSHVNSHLNQDEVNKSSVHAQKESLEKEIFQIEENTNSNETNIKHKIVKDALIGGNCDSGSTSCIDGDNSPVSQATNEEIVQHSKGGISKHPRARPKQSTGVSSKICEICNYGFRDQNALDVHMRRHNNERPFSCNQCDKAFVTRAALQRHVRVHTGEKPYKCQYCDLRFSDNTVKKNHESKHTGEAPYKCPTCEKGFGYSRTLMNHLRIHN